MRRRWRLLLDCSWFADDLFLFGLAWIQCFKDGLVIGMLKMFEMSNVMGFVSSRDVIMNEISF